jgi:hypothetical protein
MSHWLEEAEQSGHSIKPGSSLQHERMRHKKERIMINYMSNKRLYDDFISLMYQLVDRVNLLSPEKREPFVLMDARSKDSKLNNHLNIFSTSRRVIRHGKRNLLAWFKKYRFKHYRVMYINVSKIPGKVEMEFKENYLIRTILGSRKKKEKIRPAGHADRLHVLYYIDMTYLDQELALEIIDWLAFSKELAETSISKGIPEKDKKRLP